MSDQVISFGPFRLLPAQQLLLEGDRPIRLGSRARDILIALVGRPGEVVTKDELLASVWPDTFVEEANLRVHVAALRRALGDGQSGRRYVANIPGRGYSFIAPVNQATASGRFRASNIALRGQRSLPVLLMRVVGRTDIVSAISTQLPHRRLTTLVGSGGIGKTTVAVTVASQLAESYPEGVGFVDFAPIADPTLVASALAFVVGMPIRTESPIPGLVAFLKNKQMLLVFDSCEHVIDAVAALAGEIIKAAPGVHILATSREPLRVTDERIQRLSPLGFPSPSKDLKAADALMYPAVQLFVERAIESLEDFELNDANARPVAEICHKLDGIPLAIELAAARVDALDVGKMAELLDTGFHLQLRGLRTAPKRHHTLHATLDWSYELLTDDERRVLRRLAVFVGGYTMESASAILAEATFTATDIANLVANLVAKSLVSADFGGEVVRYRLVDTTRAYALEKLTESNELVGVSRRHAEYFCRMLQRTTSSDRAGGASTVEGGDMGNLRSALEWAFSPTGDNAIGVALAAATGPVFLERSLVTECESWIEKAISQLNDADRGTDRELELLTILGVSMPITRGNTIETKSALMRALVLAKSLKDDRYQIRILDALYVFHLRLAEYRKAFELASEIEALIPTASDSDVIQSADWMLGVASHFLGNHKQARSYSATALTYAPLSHRASVVRVGGDPRLHARCAIARTLWLEGHFERALSEARSTVSEARATEHAVSLCIALAWVIPISLWIGDLKGAAQNIALLVDKADEYSLAPYQAIARGLQGELSVRQGQSAAAIEHLRHSLATLRVVGHEMFITEFMSVLAEASASAGRMLRGLKTIDEALARADRIGETLFMPELLRIKGEILAVVDSSNPTSAEEQLLLSLDWARRQSAMAWELRTATSLANFWSRRGRDIEAHALLAPVYSRFDKGIATADLLAARSLLDRLNHWRSNASRTGK